MKDINNYILEKLHISKNYKSPGNFDIMKKVFEDKGMMVCYEDTEQPGVTIYADGDANGRMYPYINLVLWDDYWCEWGDEEIDHNNMELNVWVNSDDIEICDTHVLDLDPSKKGYAYTEGNAEIIAEWLTEFL